MKILKIITGAIFFIILASLFYYYLNSPNEITPQDIFVSEQDIPREQWEVLDYGGQVELLKKLANDNPKEAWEFLKSTFIVNGEVVGNVHEFAHLVGNISFEQSGLDGLKACDEAFAYGCFHGVTEKMFLQGGLESIKSIEEGCLEAFPPESAFMGYASCIHGIGHGVHSYEKGNLAKSLVDCDAIRAPYAEYCYDGVFMENADYIHAKIFDEENPWKFCTDLSEKYYRNCARYQTGVFLENSKTLNPFSGAGEYCEKGNSIILRETCFTSLGHYIAQRAMGNVTEIEENCKLMLNSEGKEICIIGGVTESVFQKYTGYNDTVNRLCGALSEVRQSECKRGMDI